MLGADGPSFAGCRRRGSWTVEETFRAGKGLTGLDEHQVRRWTSWHRWVTLAVLAHAFLAVTAATERHDHPAPDDLPRPGRAERVVGCGADRHVHTCLSGGFRDAVSGHQVVGVDQLVEVRSTVRTGDCVPRGSRATYACSTSNRSTRVRVSGATSLWPLTTFWTVASETPAAWAMPVSVVRLRATERFTVLVLSGDRLVEACTMPLAGCVVSRVHTGPRRPGAADGVEACSHRLLQGAPHAGRRAIGAQRIDALQSGWRWEARMLLGGRQAVRCNVPDQTCGFPTPRYTERPPPVRWPVYDAGTAMDWTRTI